MIIIDIIETYIVNNKYGVPILIPSIFALLVIWCTGHPKPDGSQRSRIEKTVWLCLVTLSLLVCSYYFDNRTGREFSAEIQPPPNPEPVPRKQEKPPESLLKPLVSPAPSSLPETSKPQEKKLNPEPPATKLGMLKPPATQKQTPPSKLPMISQPSIDIDPSLKDVFNTELKDLFERELNKRLLKDGISNSDINVVISGLARVREELPDKSIQYATKSGYVHIYVKIVNRFTGEQVDSFQCDGKTDVYFSDRSPPNDELQYKALANAISNIK